MIRQPVQSTNVAAVGYCRGSKTLEVEFRNGSVYQYFDVPEPVYRQLMQATSVGSFLHRNIRDKYRYSRVA